MALKNKDGFALMPLVLAALVFSALIGVGLNLITPRVRRAKIDQTTEIMSSVTQSVISWSAENGRLPVWGDNTPDGVIDEFCEITPTRLDGWKTPIVYGYDTNLTALSTGGICGRRTTALSAGGTADVAFFLISGGRDISVTATPNRSGAFTGSITSTTSDILNTVTLEHLRMAAGCFGTTRGNLKILNNELPSAIAGQPYMARIHATGGVPTGGVPAGGGTLYSWTWHQPAPTWFTLPITATADYLPLQGTPPAPGIAVIDISVSDTNGNSFRREFTISIGT